METTILDKLAYSGSELPPELGYADTMYFLMCRALYQHAKDTGMTREQGRREKNKIEAAVKRYRLEETLARHWMEIITSTESARVAYAKAKTKEEAIAAANRLVSVLNGIKMRKERHDT